MMLPQLVLLPLLALFAWGYIALRPAAGRGRRMTLFDAAVIALAAALSLVAAWLTVRLEPTPGGSVWSVVMVTVAISHTFPAVLLGGLLLRRRVFD